MFCISACTRQPRPNEVDGRDYYFYDVAHFQHLIETQAFIEWEMVYPGKYYGTLRSELERAWITNCTPMVDIDVHGAISIREQFHAEALPIFIQAPSLAVIRERLEKRGTETPQSIEERVAKAAYEMQFKDQFKHIIINDDLEKATEDLVAVVMAHI